MHNPHSLQNAVQRLEHYNVRHFGALCTLYYISNASQTCLTKYALSLYSIKGITNKYMLSTILHNNPTRGRLIITRVPHNTTIFVAC